MTCFDLWQEQPLACFNLCNYSPLTRFYLWHEPPLTCFNLWHEPPLTRFNISITPRIVMCMSNYPSVSRVMARCLFTLGVFLSCEGCVVPNRISFRYITRGQLSRKAMSTYSTFRPLMSVANHKAKFSRCSESKCVILHAASYCVMRKYMYKCRFTSLSVCRADTFVCHLSWNLGAWTSWNPQGLCRPVQGLLYLYQPLEFSHVASF